MQRLLLVLLLVGFGTLAGAFQRSALVAAVDPHAYFKFLSTHPNVWKAYSLRDQDELTTYKHRRKDEAKVTYDPRSDRYPERQDGAKIVIESDSLRNQLRLPLDLVGGSALITWDAWWGREYVTHRGELNLHKTFQITSHWDNSERFIEVRNRYDMGGAGGVSEVDIRSYWPHRSPAATGRNGRVMPIVGTFVIQPATWTRYYALWESVPKGADKFSLWIADEARDPVQLYDRVEQDAFEETLTTIWLEFNSSQDRDVALGPLVAYVRNLVVLRDVKDPTGLFQRPLSGDALPALPEARLLSPPRNLRILPSLH